MKVVVLGSGVVGVTSAWYLARAGHEVTVVDRQPAPALETSFANAGEVSPGYSAPWAAPGIPGKALKWLFMTYAPLVLRPKADPAQWRFLTGILANCTTARYKVNKGRMVRLAEYSRDKLQALRAETGITYDERTLGTLQVFRTQAQMDGIGKDTAILDAYGVPYQVLDRAGCLAVEPGLAPVADKIVGGLRLPGDETGDCFKFTQRLAEMAAGAGVEFLMGVTINRIDAEGGRVRGVDTNLGALAADAVVVALGSYSPFLVKSLGLKLPVYPVKGYSLTAPITNPDLAPVSTVMDETFKVAATRLGDRIRVAGIAEVGGFDTTFDEHRARTVVHSAKDLWSAGSDLSKREIWAGLRPMTPDGTPVVGPTAVKGLYLNTGHGTLGWTMACGSGALLADLVSGTVPEIDTEGLSLSRYQRGAQSANMGVGKPALAGH